jgi:hypothetical protein
MIATRDANNSQAKKGKKRKKKKKKERTWSNKAFTEKKRIRVEEVVQHAWLY